MTKWSLSLLAISQASNKKGGLKIEKILQDISLAKRAGKLVLGFDVVKASLQNGTALLLISAKDLSVKTNKEVAFLQQKFNINHITIDHTLDELWYILGKRVGVMSVTDKGLSEKIIYDNSNKGC